MAPIAGYRRPFLGTQPDYLWPPYRSSIKRAPSKPLVYLPQTLSEITGLSFEKEIVDVKACDLTKQHSAAPLGERIIVSGRVLDEDGRPVRNTLVEIWQANSAGRYRHKRDQHDAPLDPNFSGNGYTLTDSDGPLPFCDHEARRISVAQSRECLASGAYSFFDFRARVCHSACDADVFPWRSAASLRSYFQCARLTNCARKRLISAVRLGIDKSRMGAWLSFRHYFERA